MANLTSPSAKSALSKNVLEMKFMQRKREAELRQQLEEERQRDINEAHWTSQNSVDGSSVELGFSYADCEPIDPCARRSFHKFNPAIEKLYRQLKNSNDEEEALQREKEQSVTEEEMADRYETLVGTIAKKFSSGKSQSDSRMDDVRQQRQGSRKRKGQSGAADAEQPPRKFRKPAD